MIIFCLPVIFSLFKLVFSNWGKLDISSTFHANFCSFLIFHELESTDTSIPQQLPARGRNVHSFFSSAATQVARLWSVSFGERHHAHVCWDECLTETKIHILYDRVDHTCFHVVEMGYQMVQLLSAYIVGPTTFVSLTPAERMFYLGQLCNFQEKCEGCRLVMGQNQPPSFPSQYSHWNTPLQFLHSAIQLSACLLKTNKQWKLKQRNW